MDFNRKYPVAISTFPWFRILHKRSENPSATRTRKLCSDQGEGSISRYVKVGFGEGGARTLLPLTIIKSEQGFWGENSSLKSIWSTALSAHYVRKLENFRRKNGIFTSENRKFTMENRVIHSEKKLNSRREIENFMIKNEKSTSEIWNRYVGN
jgi:hypothetical protein